MTPEAFRASLAQSAPPERLDPPLTALWWDAKGDWERAHDAVAADATPAGAWVHAYLHRKEGDLGNARYWYRTARKPVSEGPLAAEWNALLESLISS